jgi:hypothetical protein
MLMMEMQDYMLLIKIIISIAKLLLNKGADVNIYNDGFFRFICNLPSRLC